MTPAADTVAAHALFPRARTERMPRYRVPLPGDRVRAPGLRLRAREHEGRAFLAARIHLGTAADRLEPAPGHSPPADQPAPIQKADRTYDDLQYPMNESLHNRQSWGYCLSAGALPQNIGPADPERGRG